MFSDAEDELNFVVLLDAFETEVCVCGIAAVGFVEHGLLHGDESLELLVVELHFGGVVDAFDGDVVLFEFVVGFADILVGGDGRLDFGVEGFVLVVEVDDFHAEIFHVEAVVEAVDEFVAAVDVDETGCEYVLFADGLEPVVDVEVLEPVAVDGRIIGVKKGMAKPIPALEIALDQKDFDSMRAYVEKNLDDCGYGGLDKKRILYHLSRIYKIIHK